MGQDAPQYISGCAWRAKIPGRSYTPLGNTTMFLYVPEEPLLCKLCRRRRDEYWVGAWGKTKEARISILWKNWGAKMEELVDRSYYHCMLLLVAHFFFFFNKKKKVSNAVQMWSLKFCKQSCFSNTAELSLRSWSMVLRCSGPIWLTEVLSTPFLKSEKNRIFFRSNKPNLNGHLLVIFEIPQNFFDWNIATPPYLLA